MRSTSLAATAAEAASLRGMFPGPLAARPAPGSVLDFPGTRWVPPWSETGMHTIIDFRWLLRLLVFSVGTACAGRRAPGGAYTWMDPSVGVGVAGPAYALLQEYAEDLDGPTRAAALEILVRGASEPGGGRHGIAAIWDPEPWVQRAAVRALAARGDEPASVAHLAALAARTDVPTIGKRKAS